MPRLKPPDHIRQKGWGYCLPACVQMALAQLDISVTQEQLAGLLGMRPGIGAPFSHVRRLKQAQVVMMRGYGPQASPISLRKEQRRRGALWYAYRRNHGVLHKRYVGRSAALTGARLDEVAMELSRVW